MHSIPGSEGLFELPRMLADPLRFLDERHQRHGDIFRSRFLLPIVFVVGPEANRTVHITRRHAFSYQLAFSQVAFGRIFERSLLLEDGEEHQRDRDILQPSMGRLALSESMDVIWRQWDAVANALSDGRPRDSYELVRRTTFDVAASTLTGLHLEDELEEFRPLFTAMFDGTVFPLPVRVPFTSLDRALRARETLIDRLIPRIDQARTQAPRGMVGLLAHHTGHDGSPLSSRRIAEHLLLLFWAGYDTTAAAGSWLLYELARLPEWQALVAAELESLPAGATPSQEQLNALPVLGMVLKEVERLRPAALFFPRVLVEDVEVHGHQLPKGTMVFYSPYLTHRSERLFREPARFDPGRWDPALGDKVAPATALVGFGGGPRICLGKAFALLQLRVIAAAVLRRYEVKLEPRADAKEVALPIFHVEGASLQFTARGRTTKVSAA